MANILVTGSNGFIGINLCNLLKKRGFTVKGLDLKGNHSEKSVDITNIDWAEYNLESYDAVIHLAAKVSVPESYMIPDIYEDVNKVIRELNINKDLDDKLKLIKNNIEEINSDFYQRLNNDFELITKSERELCAFLKHGLSNKEIAIIKNSTENSVNVSKARLRKKLNIASNKALQQFLFNF